MSAPPVGRFAPSPSGRMHLGNALTALLAWLSVKSRGGRFVLRIEDLDPARCRPEYARQLMDDLCWLGLTWDEGPGACEANAPYFQSQCTPYYEAALARLRCAGPVYPCYCSRADLHAASAPHLADGTALYAGTCRGLSPAQRAEKEAAGRRGALRVAVPQREVSFSDGLCGTVRQEPSTQCGDFIVRRSDGVFAYQLAVVVDDARMGVTEVVRGRDLLASTPRQIFLQQALGLATPHYFHTPLLVNGQGARLSKRDGALDLGVLRQKFTPRQLLGRLAALAGLLPAPESVSLQTLAAHFSWQAVHSADITVPEGWFS